MKRLVIVLLAFCLSQITYSQTNTFPTTGPVYIGSSLSLDGNLQFGSNSNFHLGSNSKLFNSDGFNLISWNSGGLKIGEEGYDYYLNIFGFGSKVTFNDAGIEYHSSGRHLFFGGGLEVYSDISSSGNIKLGQNKYLTSNEGLNLLGLNNGVLQIGNGDDFDVNLKGWSNRIDFVDGEIDYSAGAHYFQGLVGIGKYPAFKLDVDGDINITSGHTFKIGGVPLTGISQWLTNGSNIFYNSGNIGIGTTTPTSKLEVVGDINSSGNIKLGSNKSILDENGTPLIGRRDGVIEIGNENDNNVRVWGFGGSNIFLYDGQVDYYSNGFHQFLGGSVGIGITPSYKLDVDGDINISSGHTFKIGGVPFTGSKWLTGTNNNIYYNAGNIGIGTTNPFNKLHIDAGNATASYTQFTVGTTTGQTITDGTLFGIDASGTTIIKQQENLPILFFTNNIERVRVSNTGNIGVGITNPLNKLQLDAGSATACYNQFTVGTTTGQTATDGTLFGTDATGNTIIKQQENLPLLFFTNNIERFRVSSTGYVGIGTLTPTYKLDVTGDINISSGSSFRIGGVAISGSQWLTSSNNISYNSGYVGIGTTNPIASLQVNGKTYLETGEDVDAFKIYNSPKGKTAFRYDSDNDIVMLQENGGNVGIGTSNPIANLQIGQGTENGLLGFGGYSFAGSLRSSGDLFMGYNVYSKYTSSSENGVLRAHSSIGTGYSAVQFGNNGDIKFYQSSDPQSFQDDDQINFVPTIAFKGDGNVGIGTAAPTAKLDVNGSGKFNGNFYVLNGNVGIGTTNPTAKLAVNGTIMAKEINITLTGWSDFVFHSSYKLRTLGEVEKFIKANNHLPEIPSETEVKENGISVGEMNAKLLQKIEELTLYVIDLQKQVNELKSKK